jgi:uncharacterized protein
VGLQKCPDCGTDVSTAALACPKCGRPFAKGKPSAKNVGCGSVLLLFAAVGILVAMCSRNTEQSTVESKQGNPHTPTVPAPSPTHVSPSFDCTKARSQPERLICTDPELAALDAELSTLYEKARAAAPNKVAFARQNRAEWKRREATCSAKQCILDWYALRRRQLTAVLEAAGGVASSSPGASSASDGVASPKSNLNLSDAKALDEKYGIAAAVHCSSEADDYLRSIAKYDFKWDETGFLESKFNKYLLHVVSPGVLTSTSDKAKLQNGFGAYQRMEILCDYDTQTEKVLRYRVADQSP